MRLTASPCKRFRSQGALRCVRLLAERHREQIALNTIIVVTKPQMTLARM